MLHKIRDLLARIRATIVIRLATEVVCLSTMGIHQSKSQRAEVKKLVKAAYSTERYITKLRKQGRELDINEITAVYKANMEA